ncbi:hypothetical protein [Phytohabitans rumicis]|uniref:Uncharacterized protein n=1 Tax=Phytohabitans rumicis TaxID=1076125 RepID=A0A6V8KWW8_9ACTN|nr:hypothetical protein [Phytohabitans rumicis]GFJ87168.1 hypothetical protein Prum_008100 [Phytohabitans rumicis]
MTAPLPGEVGIPIQVSEQQLTVMLREAFARGEDPNVPFVWQDLDSELFVDLRTLRVALRDGLLLVGLTVRCDETGGDRGEGIELVVPIALGSQAEPAGLVGTVETAARGPSALVVAVWGETVVAATWLAFLAVCREVAGRAGLDAKRQPLLPGAVWAAPGRLGVVPQARHAIDQAGLS